MKKLFFIAAIVLVCGVSSCYHRTCPTYTKGLKDIPQEKQQQENKDVKG